MLIHLLGEGKKEFAQDIGFLPVSSAKNQAIVLVGDKSLLVTSLGTERQPAPGYWW